MRSASSSIPRSDRDRAQRSASASTNGSFSRVSACAGTFELLRRPTVVAGVGAAATSVAIERARFAERAGADGVLAVTPYYVRPNERGLFAHFAALAEAVELPIVLYNVPARTGTDLAPRVVAGRISAPPDPLPLQQLEVAFCNGIVVAVSAPAHARFQIVLM